MYFPTKKGSKPHSSTLSVSWYFLIARVLQDRFQVETVSHAFQNDIETVATFDVGVTLDFMDLFFRQ